MNNDRARQLSQNRKPAFNVVEPFQGVLIVQMNEEFSALLSDFIDDIDGNVESEIKALQFALRNPQGRMRRRRSDDS